MAEEAFVNVWFDSDKDDGVPQTAGDKDFYGKWTKQASARHSSPALFGADALRRIYPKHSIVMTSDYQLNVLNFPGASVNPVDKTPLITNLAFIPFARHLGSIPGVLVDRIEFGTFELTWDKYKFLLVTVQYPAGFGNITQNYILHEGSEGPARSLLLSVGSWADQLHDEIWVFNQGFWQKDHGLWKEVQKADWKDVILKDEFKKTLQKDVYGFFASEEIYKQLSIPWKRGLIMYGPPGNGKTISMKTIMKTCGDDGFAPLYVKSFQSWKGEEGAMADVFDKARQLAPCVVVLEDLDSLINDRNRSFFLNQLDGLEGNDGLLIIGTTNHFERLDPGLSTRPSRFDRKFKFDDPDREERALYVQYWQKKLKDNKDIFFPDRLVDEVANLTDHFSFAYLKEAFVSSLVWLAGYDGDGKPTFETALKTQIKSLRKQLDKSGTQGVTGFERARNASSKFTPGRPMRPENERDVHILLDALSDSVRPNKIFDMARSFQEPSFPGSMNHLSEALPQVDHTSHRLFDAIVPNAHNNRFEFGGNPSIDPRIPGQFTPSLRNIDIPQIPSSSRVTSGSNDGQSRFYAPFYDPRQV